MYSYVLILVYQHNINITQGSVNVAQKPLLKELPITFFEFEPIPILFHFYSNWAESVLQLLLEYFLNTTICTMPPLHFVLQNLSLLSCSFVSALLYDRSKMIHEMRTCSRSWLVAIPMSLLISQSIPCKDLVLRAHYFLLSSQSKVTLSLLRLETRVEIREYSVHWVVKL